MLQPKIAILYGNGGDLGNLDVFAQGIRRRVVAGFDPRNVIVKSVILKADFFRFLETFVSDFVGQITELHIVSHAIGAGLFPGYHVASVDAHRRRSLEKAVQERRRITYEECVVAETGAILTDDFLRPQIAGKREKYIRALSPLATIKLWGCNSGLVNWTYSDNGETDPNVRREDIAFYWRALNLRNTPKPAIAQAFADFFQRTTYGAKSGAHVEVLHRGAWVKSERYRADLHRWPSPSMVHRLHPDRGEYDAFRPGLLP